MMLGLKLIITIRIISSHHFTVKHGAEILKVFLPAFLIKLQALQNRIFLLNLIIIYEMMHAATTVLKGAFNDYFIRNMIVRRDGGFILAAESFFSTGRGGSANRYDYMYGSPFLRPMDYYNFGPYGYGYGYPWYRYNSMGQSTRYNAQNIAVFSFDSTGQMSWSNVLNKNQYDDETDAFIGYSLMNTGDQLHFLFNQQEKRLQLLNDQSISPEDK